jgi:hypothetical protein
MTEGFLLRFEGVNLSSAQLTADPTRDSAGVSRPSAPQNETQPQAFRCLVKRFASDEKDGRGHNQRDQK